MTLNEIVDKRLTVVLIWLTLAVGSTYLFIFEPGKSGLFLVCPFFALTGFACPGCGTAADSTTCSTATWLELFGLIH